MMPNDRLTEREHGAIAADMILTGLVRLEIGTEIEIERAAELMAGWMQETLDEGNPSEIALYEALYVWIYAKRDAYLNATTS
jgi:hypothetical protein